jgi:hypothetical protein
LLNWLNSYTTDFTFGRSTIGVMGERNQHVFEFEDLVGQSGGGDFWRSVSACRFLAVETEHTGVRRSAFDYLIELVIPHVV